MLDKISTIYQYTTALQELQELWEKAEPGTPEGDRFEILGKLLDEYEREHFPIPAPDPEEAIRFREEQEK